MSTVCPVCSNPIEQDASFCPHCGFKLLGSTQQFKPVLLADETIEPEVPQTQQAELRVVRGPQTGVAVQLGDRGLTVGRSPQCDIFLNDMTVSREHAVIEPVDGGGYVIRDENSFNGVWVSNDSIDEHRLASGDIIQIGAFLLLYQEG